ncbi:MAG: iron-containing alcohol dehydrogenase [Desulfamplus sp.]|nr:iron-containing alcohol dehydrogenase [Desulfamplus sp.]
MEGSRVFKLVIQSHKGPYTVFFQHDFERLTNLTPENKHILIDKKVADLYERELSNILNFPSVLQIDATEMNKSLDCFTKYVEHLVNSGVRRGHQLIAIGGGIIQDITCFLASTMLRGLPWVFYPTTLLAQADSCIGSKSSINAAGTKNILGTFTPPAEIFIHTKFLKTLQISEWQSGVGEMLKVHAIHHPKSFDQIAKDYEHIFKNIDVMNKYIFQSLEFKKILIEMDEFDQGPRNVMNYGHSFGHAIESASNFAIPHGVAVTMGMDLANYVAMKLGKTKKEHYQRMHSVLKQNYMDFKNIVIPKQPFFDALKKDKKNTNTQLRLILPSEDGVINIGLYENDSFFNNICCEYLDSISCS